MRQDVDAAARFYTRISRVYDVIADPGERAARERGLDLLDAGPGERILELGFGTGTAMVRIARAVGDRGRVFGVDVSDGMREVAADRVVTAGLSGIVDLVVAAVPPIPVQDAELDAVFMAFTLELFPDDVIPMVLREIQRVLRSGGRLVLVAMDEGDQRHRLVERVYRRLHRYFPHLVDCRPIDVTGLLMQNRFAIRQMETIGVWRLPVRVCAAFPVCRPSLTLAAALASDEGRGHKKR
jgi:ubiquinone/menaquinone biosynthesis C-methylase UbiE